MESRMIHTYLKQRKLELWIAITKLYEIEDSVNTKVHTCIMEGKPLITLARQSAVQPYDTPTVPPRS